MAQAFVYYVYIMSNKGLTTMYIGVTNNLERRVLEHKLGKGSKFTTKYKLDRLIYLEEFEDVTNAIAREKQLKNWHRDWKWNLIKSLNPGLKDLSEGWYDETLKQVQGVVLKQVQGDNK
jgi:putative endonuclease